MKRLMLSLALVGYVLVTSVAHAQYGPYEGPKPSFDILVDKLVSLPRETKGGKVVFDFVDNLGPDDHKYGARDFIFFKVIVRNTSTQKIENVVIKDTVPNFVDLFDDPGTFDQNTRVYTIQVGDLAAGEQKEYVLRGRIVEKDRLSVNTRITCLTNFVRAEDGGVADEDTAQFCVEKPDEAEGVTTIPSAGAEHTIAILGIALIVGMFGLRLRRATI
ncbi:MAG: hypothetical protein ACE5DQ_01390 [Candidatus Paceibacterota bacterium]